jgi:hypothetical protein
MVIVDGAPSWATLLVAAARRQMPLMCKQQDECHLAASLLDHIFQWIRENPES